MCRANTGVAYVAVSHRTRSVLPAVRAAATCELGGRTLGVRLAALLDRGWLATVHPVSARLFWMGWLFHLKGLTHSLFFVLVSVLQPVIFASIAFFMFEPAAARGRCSTSRSAPG